MPGAIGWGMNTTTTTTTRRDALLATLGRLVAFLILGAFYMVPRILLDAETKTDAVRDLTCYALLGSVFATYYLLTTTPATD